MVRTTSQGLVIYESGDPATVIATGMPTGDSVDAAIARTAVSGVDAAEAAVDAVIDSRNLIEAQTGADETLAFTITDNEGHRSWLEIGNNGKPSIAAAATIKETVLEGVSLPEQGPDSSGVAFAVVDSTGRRSWLESGFDGKPTANSLALLGSVGGTATQYRAPNLSVHPVTSPLIGRAYGDSTTYGADLATPVGNRWTDLLAGLMGIPISNYGASGGRAEEIAARFGAVIPAGQISGGSIPASGSVVVSGLDIDPMRVLVGSSTSTLLVEVLTEAGVRVPGTFTRTADPAAPTFTRTTAGAVIPAAGWVDIYATAGPTHWDDLIFIGQGINNEPLVAAGTQTVDDVKAWYRAMTSVLTPLRPRFVIWGVLDRGVAEAPGTTNGNFIAALETWLKQTYGAAYLPFRQYLASPRALADAARYQPGFTPTSEDTAAQSAKTVPPSFRALSGTSVHMNELGHILQARYFHRNLTSPQKGWTI